MSIVVNHGVGLFNLWVFPLVYGIISLIVMCNITLLGRKRILTFPKMGKEKGINVGMAGFIMGKVLILYSIFVPIKSFDIYFYVGTIIYALGLSLSVYAMWSFSKADLSKPVTQGIYRISRHPMQMMSFIMWLGIAIVSKTWLVLVLALLYPILSYPSLKAQEQFCLDKYGEQYNSYMKITPRYLLV